MKASKNILVVIGGVVVGLLLVGAAAALSVGVWRLAKSEANLKGLKGVWRRFYEQGNPFASRENILKEKKNNETIDFWFAELLKELRKGQIAPGKGKSAAAFGDDLRQERDKMRAAAEAKGVSLPAGFAFGFDRYAGGGAVLPVVENVPYLWQQLETIERLYNLIIESDVKAILSIGREEFDVASQDVATRPPVSAPGGGPAEGGTLVKPGTVLGDSLYGNLHFSFVFNAKESTVWALLDLMARQDMIIVVTSVQVDGQGLDVVKAALPTMVAKEDPRSKEDALVTTGVVKGGLRARRAAAAAAEREKAQEEEQPKEKSADNRIPSRLERVICGPSKAAPVRVKIELDVYRFKD